MAMGSMSIKTAIRVVTERRRLAVNALEKAVGVQ